MRGTLGYAQSKLHKLVCRLLLQKRNDHSSERGSHDINESLNVSVLDYQGRLS